LIAAGPVRAVDVGEVSARGMKRPRAFLELGAVGVAAPLAVAGQGFEKGHWDAVTRHLPQAIDMSPAILGVRLDGKGSVHRAHSLLAVVANTPRAGAGLMVAPEARIDDGMLEVRVYEEMSQPVLAAHFLAVKAGTAAPDPRVRSSRGRKIVIRSTVPLPVVVETKVVGSTPAHFRVVTGGLLVIAGRGDGLTYPAAQSLVAAVKENSMAAGLPESASSAAQIAPPKATAISPGRALAGRGRPLGIALATGVAVALMPAVSRWIGRRVHG
jgi:diacylglycerol kinase family enzyme